jgi:hypothetical protein
MIKNLIYFKEFICDAKLRALHPHYEKNERVHALKLGMARKNIESFPILFFIGKLAH